MTSLLHLHRDSASHAAKHTGLSQPYLCGKNAVCLGKAAREQGKGEACPQGGCRKGQLPRPRPRPAHHAPSPPLRVFTSSSPWTRGQANTLPASGLGLIRMRTLRAGARLARAARGWTPQAGGLQGERLSDDHSVPHRHDPARVPAPWKRPGRWQEAGSGGSG